MSTFVEVITHIVEDVDPAEQNAAVEYAEWLGDSGLEADQGGDTITIPDMGANDRLKCQSQKERKQGLRQQAY